MRTRRAAPLDAVQRNELQYTLNIIGHNRDIRQDFLRHSTPADAIVDMCGDDQYQDMPVPAAIPVRRGRPRAPASCHRWAGLNGTI